MRAVTSRSVNCKYFSQVFFLGYVRITSCMKCAKIRDVLPNRLCKRDSAKWKLRETFTANFEYKLQINRKGDVADLNDIEKKEIVYYCIFKF